MTSAAVNDPGTVISCDNDGIIVYSIGGLRVEAKLEPHIPLFNQYTLRNGEQHG